MKILILCAGIGSRLGNLTSENPKCLVEVNSISILDRLLSQLTNLGLNEKDIFLCGGYKNELLPTKYRKFININFLTTNMMKTTIFGLNQLSVEINYEEDVLIIYGDCLYSDAVIKELIRDIKCFSGITLPVDLDWREKWSKRYENIYDDAETLEYDVKNNKLISIGKKTLLEEQYMAQFMGIYIIPNKLIDCFINEYHALSFQLQQEISTTEFFQKTLGKLNYFVKPGKYIWTEVDTIDDLLYAKKIFL